MSLMGIHKNNKINNNVQNVSKKCDTKTILICLCSIFASIIGGVVLVYWRIKFHSKNKELWMVPFGLVMFTTPILVWIISIASDVCCPKEEKPEDGFRHGPAHDDLEQQ
ncbi:hypothetical protein RND81_06G038800 [Saponaria officinalis]|uniref:Transmembrane protein n=1 Tax=Saponaria officinalis TaxID=3572 RepID=A0AAW1K430_SAPOF